MRYSQFYAPTKKSIAKTDSINAYLLVKAGYIAQIAAGVYVLLPLGWRTIQKIEQVVREEMNAIGGNEVFFTALQPQQTWEESGRWNDKNFRSIIYYDKESGMTFGATHEEPMAQIVKESIQSYRDLPILLYQFQTKFRNELRAKSGLLRGREFIMKDLYSFHPDKESHEKFYEEVAKAYSKIFKRLGLDAYRVKASGGVFTDELSDEFQVICPTGEDEVLVDHQTKTGYNREVEQIILAQEKQRLESVKSIEVGNIFHDGTKYTDAFHVNYLDPMGQRQSVVMGAYGIGITRLLGALAEIYNDQQGLKLPEVVTPFKIHLIDLTNSEKGEEIYRQLTGEKIEVLFDNRSLGAGEKLVEADLIGLPIRMVYSSKTAEHNSVELKYRDKKDTQLVKLDQLLEKLA